MKTAKDLIASILVMFLVTFLVILKADLENKQYGNSEVSLVMVLIISCLLYLMYKPKKTKGMTGRDYELYCAKYLISKGFRIVQTTPITGDYGADLTAKDWLGNNWVFQCKRYSGNVGVKAVQEVCAARKHYSANKAAIITNSKFTKSAKQLAMENNIELFEMIEEK
ncbi:restriction endonuclease [Ruminococcus albus]|uniref:Restriction endonuclease n=1 Tax=Ruminococcus albus TaxID=1264 RepID=A0A1I1RPX0_RUMAL|nr:restriction endonuclease [Ruminococcus albus]SFD32590.1 Restriction endonuclease [Ruminococcus albus]